MDVLFPNKRWICGNGRLLFLIGQISVIKFATTKMHNNWSRSRCPCWISCIATFTSFPLL